MNTAFSTRFTALIATLTLGLAASQIANVVAADPPTETAGGWVKDPKNPDAPAKPQVIEISMQRAK